MMLNSTNMLRARRKDINLKPNRRLDRKSSRGMLYENEELRLRTININAEIERGQSDIKKLRRENEQLRKEIWCLRDEYDKLDRLLRSKEEDNSRSSTPGDRDNRLNDLQTVCEEDNANPTTTTTTTTTTTNTNTNTPNSRAKPDVLVGEPAAYRSELNVVLQQQQQQQQQLLQKAPHDTKKPAIISRQLSRQFSSSDKKQQHHHTFPHHLRDSLLDDLDDDLASSTSPRKMSQMSNFRSVNGKIPWCGCWGNGCL